MSNQSRLLKQFILETVRNLHEREEDFDESDEELDEFSGGGVIGVALPLGMSPDDVSNGAPRVSKKKKLGEKHCCEMKLGVANPDGFNGFRPDFGVEDETGPEVGDWVISKFGRKEVFLQKMGSSTEGKFKNVSDALTHLKKKLGGRVSEPTWVETNFDEYEKLN